MYKIIARRTLASALALAIVIPSFWWARGIVNANAPPTSISVAENPYVTGGRIRTAETAIGSAVALTQNPKSSQYELWLAENNGHYTKTVVEVIFGEEVRTMYRIPYQGSFIFSTNQQTTHQRLSRDNFNHTVSFYPIEGDVVKHYTINSFNRLPSGHFTIPYNLLLPRTPRATGGASHVPPGQGGGIWTTTVGGMMISYITDEKDQGVEWYTQGKFLVPGEAPGWEGNPASVQHRTLMHGGNHSKLTEFEVEGRMGGNGHGWKAFGELPGYRSGYFAPPLQALNTNVMSIRGTGGSATPIRDLLGTASRAQLEAAHNRIRDGVATAADHAMLEHNWRMIEALLIEMDSDYAPMVRTLIETKRAVPGLPQIIIIFEPVVSFTQAGNTHASYTVNNLRRMLNLTPPGIRLADHAGGTNVFPNQFPDDSVRLGRLLHYDEPGIGVAEGVNTLYSFFISSPTVAPTFNCTMAGVPNSNEEWTFSPQASWNAHPTNVSEWNAAVQSRQADIDATGDDETRLKQISQEISATLWRSWANRGLMNSFEHPQHGRLPGGTNNGIPVVEAAARLICGIDPIKLPFIVTAADALASVGGPGGSGLSQVVLDCVTDMSVTIDWATHGALSPFNCTSPAEVSQWENWARNRGAQELLEQMRAIDPAKKAVNPPPTPLGCTPSSYDIPGHHYTNNVNRGGDHREAEAPTGLRQSESVELRWNNLAFAFGETHMATSGFNNEGPSTPASTINLTRTSEVFQAMAGNISPSHSVMSV